jgi:hypothetical protein
MNLVSLLILPAIIKLYHKDRLLLLKQSPKAGALVVALLALIVVGAAITFSKKGGKAMADAQG